jgi:hypothetical protein
MVAKKAIVVIITADKSIHMKSYQRFYYILVKELSWAEVYNFRF